MKITLLCENEVCDMHWLAEWGFSAFIEYNDVRILFDTGLSDVYRHNAARAGIDLETADFVALSHFHNDHTGGLRHHGFESRKKILMHPRVLEELQNPASKSFKTGYREIHSILQNDFEVVAAKGALEFSTGAFFLGQIPRRNDFEAGEVPELAAYDIVRPEVKYGEASRIDFLLQGNGLPDTYVEVKSVTLMRKQGLAEFPDCVTKRGTKHLVELGRMVAAGHRAVMLYLVQRTDCARFTLASDIDPAYAAAYKTARAAGVEVICIGTKITPEGVWLTQALEVSVSLPYLDDNN